MKNRLILPISLCLGMACLSHGAMAAAKQDTNSHLVPNPSHSTEWNDKSEKGWFWGYWQKLQAKKKRQAEAAKKAKQAAKEAAKPPDCTDPDEWTVDCGFVDPGHNYEFSQKEFHALTKQFAMYSDDPDKVLQYQKYIKWAVNKAVMAAKTGEWNLIQHQDINPFITNPVSTFGIRAATMEAAGYEQSLMQDIKSQGGRLVMFSRSDCDYCHKAAPVIRYVSEHTDIPLYDASLDDTCLPKFGKEHCYTGDTIVKAAQHLNVKIVPDLWLYMPKDTAWIRVSSGLESADVIKSRIKLFFGAAKKAAQKGFVKAAGGSVQPAVDFSQDTLHEVANKHIGLAKGVKASNDKHSQHQEDSHHD